MYKILAYYDVPQVIEVRDQIGGHYVGVYVGGDSRLGDYVIAGISPYCLRQFKAGDIDLLALLTERPAGIGWRMAQFVKNGSVEMLLSDERQDDIPPDYLPDRGFFLQNTYDVDWLVEKAREDHSLVLAITVEPPEAENHRVHSDGLGKLLINLQRLIKHAYARWARDAKEFAFPSGHIFDVCGWRPTSFQIILEPSERENLFGSFEGLPALEIIGELFSHAGDPDATSKLIAEKYRGHLASAYRDLLDVLITQETRFEIAWADTAQERATSYRMTLSEAKNIKLRLNMVNRLTEETVKLRGQVLDANVKTGGWLLSTAEGERSGKTADGGPDFEGVVMYQQYLFECSETLEVTGTGSERALLQLERYEKL